MLERALALIDRGWRIVATGMCFALFGLGGLMLRLVVFPILQSLVRDPQQRVKWARHIIRLAFRAFVEVMHMSGVIRYETVSYTHLTLPTKA